MVRRQDRSPATRKTAAVVMLTVLTVVVVGASAQFLGWFTGTSTVTLYAPRAGLVMNPDAAVKLRGVDVGRVGSISEQDGQAVLTLEMFPDQMASIPGNVIADIKSNTIFGAKTVNLTIPATGAEDGHLRAGQIISADRVVVELNTVYQQLVSVLAELQPEKLSATLGALDEALTGRGEEVGNALGELSELLGTTNPHLPELNRMLAEAATVTNVYADAAPDLLRTVDNATVLGNTLLENAANLDALLINATGMANTINGIFAPSKDTLIGALSDLSPTAAMLGYQSPGLACFITAAAIGSEKATPLVGGEYGIKLFAGLMPGSEPYQYPQDLPQTGVQGAPTCEGPLSNPDDTEHVDFYVTDNADRPYQPRTTAKVNRQKVFQLLFGGPPSG